MTTKFSANDVIALEKDVELYSGYFKVKRYKFQYPLFEGGISSPVLRELVIRSQAVGVLLVDFNKECVVLIEQFRAGASLFSDTPWLLEISSGLTDPGESMEEAAVREVREETGIEVASLKPLYNYFTSPGMSNEMVHLYVAEIDSSLITAGIFGVADEGENIRTSIIPFQEAFNLLATGKIINASTLIALQWLQFKTKTL